MKIIILPLLSLLLAGCHNSAEKPAASNARIELIPEPDKNEQHVTSLPKMNEVDEPDEETLRYRELKRTRCLYQDPDTSLCGIVIGKPKSFLKFDSKAGNCDDNGKYFYYSAGHKEIMTLYKFEGDVRYSIMNFKVEHSNENKHDYKTLDSIKHFASGKGIHLGMNKNEIVEILGNCYSPIDSATDYIELYYRLEVGDDTLSQVLVSRNAPIYYGSYKFSNNHLREFEFGFQYP